MVAWHKYDSFLLVSFGGPERREDVIPFLENVLRGRNVPRERLLEVAEHYYHFDGVSPINAHCRELMAALKVEFQSRGIGLPFYWGNRNWGPLIEDTAAQMVRDGVKRAISLATAAFSSYSSCRQYLEDIARARAAVGEEVLQIDKLRPFYNHPRFVAASIDRFRTAWEMIPEDRRRQARAVFTAHSIPLSMANTCDYAAQLRELSGLVAAAAGVPAERWSLVYQSRSGRPEDPWLEPDVIDHLQSLAADSRGDDSHAPTASPLAPRPSPLPVTDVVVMPIGFLSDHMEVMYDLDVEAADACREWGVNMVRAATVGTHPQFIAMIADLVLERLSGTDDRAAVGTRPAWSDVCPVDCCPAPRRRPEATGS